MHPESIWCTWDASVCTYLNCFFLAHRYIYKSLGEVQIEREEELAKYPISRPEAEVDQTPAEVLYQHMFPSLPQYMIALLKILLAAAPGWRVRRLIRRRSDRFMLVMCVLCEVGETQHHAACHITLRLQH